MATLKLVQILITVFTEETNGKILNQYLWDCLKAGMASDLYESPAITALFYAEGNDAYYVLADSIEFYDNNQNPENNKVVKAKMALVVIWLRSYAAQVQVIANLPINCTTREEAEININSSHLSAQKLVNKEKGIPDAPLFSAKLVDGILEITITNGPSYNPTSISIIAVAVPPVSEPATPMPVVSLVQATATVSVVSSVAIQMVSRTFSGKGKSAKIGGATLATAYQLVGYAQNGNKQCSILSAPVLVTIITPPAPSK